MRKCEKMKKDLTDFLSSELDAERSRALKKHLKACPACAAAFEEMKKIMEGAESFQEEVTQVMESVDWEALPHKMADSIFRKEIRLPRESNILKFWKSIFLPRGIPVYAGIVAGIIIGSLATFLVLKPNVLMRPKGEKIFASADFIEKVELQMAKRETLDYLDKSQYLILDFIQSPSENVRLGQNVFAIQKARDLLSKKKYINQQLNKFQMAKAKEICDQIEVLFLELSQISEELTAEEIAKIQDFVKQKQLLLKIKLVQKELEESEV